MNIYLIWQTKNKEGDTYDSAVVIAESEEDAKSIHPGHNSKNYEDIPIPSEWDGKGWDDWSDKEYVRVKLIGTAVVGQERGILCASFNRA